MPTVTREIFQPTMLVLYLWLQMLKQGVTMADLQPLLLQISAVKNPSLRRMIILLLKKKESEGMKGIEIISAIKGRVVTWAFYGKGIECHPHSVSRSCPLYSHF